MGQDLRQLSIDFIGAAFEALRQARVIPTPVYHPFVSVGADYYGASIRGPEYRALEAALNETFPNRFAEPLKRQDSEFASTYIISLLEGAVARCGHTGRFDVDSEGIQKSVDELLNVLAADKYEAVCCRAVAHFATQGQDAVQVEQIRVIPEEETGQRSFERLIPREIPAAPGALGRDPPFYHDPPHALLVIREPTEALNPYTAAELLSMRLERFLLLVRLLTAATVRSHYEVRGTGTLVSRMPPHLERFLGADRSMIRRTINPDTLDGRAITEVGELLDNAKVTREGMVMASFDVAIRKYNGSYHSTDLFEQLVDLATALEATLVSDEGDSAGLVLRLRNRAASLLATEKDPARTVFKDVGLLYDIRSKLVHGGEIREKRLRRSVHAISSVPPPEQPHLTRPMLAYAVDRMRDLVRRAILARLCLAAEPDELWPFEAGDMSSLDELLADDRTRRLWRETWQKRLSELGVAAAADPPRQAVDFLSPGDQ